MRGGFRVARSSRALVLASRQDELPSRIFPEIVHEISPDAAGKFAKAGRLRQRSGRACYPEFRRALRDRAGAERLWRQPSRFRRRA